MRGPLKIPMVSGLWPVPRGKSGVHTLVSSQKRRAAIVPRINRGSSADFVPRSVYITSHLQSNILSRCLRAVFYLSILYYIIL